MMDLNNKEKELINLLDMARRSHGGAVQINLLLTEKDFTIIQTTAINVSEELPSGQSVPTAQGTQTGVNLGTDANLTINQ